MLIEEGEIKGKVKCCNEVQVDWIVNKVRYKTQTETQAPFTLFSYFGGDFGVNIVVKDTCGKEKKRQKRKK